MARVEASEQRTFRVRAPLADVYAIFADPTRRKQFQNDLESCELLAPNKAKWTIVERREKGIRFQSTYTVVYEGNGVDQASWHTVAGNTGNSGKVTLKAIDERTTEIIYRETFEPDLPVPRLAVKIFRPLVVAEVRKGITAFVDNLIRALGRA